MELATDAAALLEAFAEPILVGGEDGAIIYANRAAAALAGERLAGKRLAEIHCGDSGTLDSYLRRCLGSRQPLVGILVLRGAGEPQKYQCRGSLIAAEGRRAILLRLSRVDEERFAALTQKVEELSREVSERQRNKAILEETLRDRELLLRELQHRVKNNMHMLAAMLSGAEREAESPEAKAALRDASLRFSAVSAVQQLLYGSDDLETIGSEALVATLLRAVLGIAPDGVRTEAAVDPVDLPIDAAVPIALMLNELLTNAIKYGRPSQGGQEVRVGFRATGDQIELVVTDNGPGFDLAGQGKRASGLGLVRGLLRQLGGSFRVESDGGSRCIAAFPDPRMRAGRSAA